MNHLILEAAAACGAMGGLLGFIAGTTWATPRHIQAIRHANPNAWTTRDDAS